MLYTLSWLQIRQCWLSLSTTGITGMCPVDRVFWGWGQVRTDSLISYELYPYIPSATFFTGIENKAIPILTWKHTKILVLLQNEKSIVMPAWPGNMQHNVQFAHGSMVQSRRGKRPHRDFSSICIWRYLQKYPKQYGS